MMMGAKRIAIGDYRVNRGACWLNRPDECRSAARTYGNHGVGGISDRFRVAVLSSED